MKNILLPTDFSENSWNAIEFAIRFLENTRCHFYILHVNTTDDCSTIKDKFQQLTARISQTFPKNILHKYITLTNNSSCIQAVRHEVEDKEIDMMIIGAKGISDSQAHIVGNFAENIITKVKCNVLIIPENVTYKTFNEVAFPTDFTLSTDIRTLSPITTLLHDITALRVLYINKVSHQLNHQQQANKALLEDFLDNYEYSFHFLTHHNTENAVEDFVQNKDIDLMIMAAKNLNYFKKILFHSNVANINYHTKIPFLIMHE
ncbi:universal stress protein [Kordia zhangzhouensis]|uniref:universal stress protein n=1 Tax=Kordia zhangzhouensis TaxID=1620405 RepID=UPI0006298A72|nr:universal stress protein [Kordia zhangzhouensis]